MESSGWGAWCVAPYFIFPSVHEERCIPAIACEERFVFVPTFQACEERLAYVLLGTSVPAASGGRAPTSLLFEVELAQGARE
ncbi:hypothetical protein NDU88_002211 [Pleurodeles waltl]|uniref:Uncharacterized protein n=1 Tax=Pleurodeles waltl TaxID=8319 RepID=A0AAV7W3X5_PLEWA|nr:hypothetical protein NDU88_002211 [Pleurodeles waltl]